MLTRMWSHIVRVFVGHRGLDCNTLQHTAAHCNTHLPRTISRLTHVVSDSAGVCGAQRTWLQHAATRCNTLQHTSASYNLEIDSCGLTQCGYLRGRPCPLRFGRCSQSRDSMRQMCQCRIFRFFRLSRPQAPHKKLNTENNRLNQMTLRHVGQFDGIHCDSRTHKVLSNYILMLGFFFVVHCVWSFQVHMFKFTLADISRFWSILGIL